MITFRNIAWLLAALAVTVFFGAGAYVLLDMNAKIIGPFEKAMKGQHASGDDGYTVLVQRFLQNTAAAANAVKQTAQDSNRIAKAQEKPVNDLTISSVALVNTGKETVGKLGNSIDSLNATITDIRAGTLPRINAGVDGLTGTVTSLNGLVSDLRPTAQALTGAVNESGNAVKALNLTISHADALIADPAFHQIAGNLSMMSLNLTNASANINSATGHADRALGFVELDLSPKHEPLWRSLVSEALSQAIGIPLKWLPSRTAIVSSVPVQVTK